MSSVKKPFSSLTVVLAALTVGCASSGGASQADAELAAAVEAALTPASAEERAKANRSDPLTRANFWSTEYQKDSQNAEVAMEFAEALRGIGSQSRAAEVLSTTLVLNPGHTDMMMMLGRMHMAAGDYAAAQKQFEKVSQQSPGRADAWAALGTAYDQMELHRPAQAAYQRALALEPRRTTTLTNFGLSLLLSGDLEGAEAQLRAAAGNEDATSRVHENLALVLGLQGRFDEMKQVSAVTAPANVAEQNVALVRAMVQPARSYDALSRAETAGTPASRAAEPESGPVKATRKLRGSGALN